MTPEAVKDPTKIARSTIVFLVLSDGDNLELKEEKIFMIDRTMNWNGQPPRTRMGYRKT